MLRSRNRGSVKLKSTCARSRLPEKPSLTYWPLPSEVALGDADVADHAFAGGITDAEGELAGRLLLYLDHEHHAVGRAPGSVSISTVLK
jgi:hypothetical protein